MGQRREVWISDDGLQHDTEEEMSEHEAHLAAMERARRYVLYCGSGESRAATRIANTIAGYEEWRRMGCGYGEKSEDQSGGQIGPRAARAPPALALLGDTQLVFLGEAQSRRPGAGLRWSGRYRTQ